jgi:hypothetical protein
MNAENAEENLWDQIRSCDETVTLRPPLLCILNATQVPGLFLSGELVII